MSPEPLIPAPDGSHRPAPTKSFEGYAAWQPEKRALFRRRDLLELQAITQLCGRHAGFGDQPTSHRTRLSAATAGAAFHDLLLLAAPNPLLMKEARALRRLDVSAACEPDEHTAQLAHQRLVELVLRGGAGEALELWQDHLDELYCYTVSSAPPSQSCCRPAPERRPRWALSEWRSNDDR